MSFVPKEDIHIKIIKKDRLVRLVDEMVKNNEVMAPKDELSFGKINSSAEIRLDCQNTTKSVKEFFFPGWEKLLNYRLDKKEVTIIPQHSPLTTPRVVFAARPCDAASLFVLDKLFAWDYKDPFYIKKREKTTIVSLACSQPAKTCFCTSLGGSPAGVKGSDILLLPMDNVYYVQVISNKGEALIENYKGLFEESNKEQDKKKKQVEKDLEKKVIRKVDIEGLCEVLDFENPVWRTIAQQCIDCGICTFLCPTCHCFDIQDEGNPNEGCRVRVWDSCAFPEFTKMSGAQPRSTRYRRYRQRIMHKFKYYPQNFDEALCVGCGRCIQYCPVGVDITEVLTQFLLREKVKS